MTLHSDASRHYGLAVSDAVADQIDPGVLFRWTPSADHLVEAHLKDNYAYFGAIDKTLSGFVVIDDEGDDHTLLDLRGGGRVWWQDHETRELELRFDSFADWLEFRAEVAKAAEDEEHERTEWAVYEEWPKPDPEHPEARRPTSARLAERYQWLVWLLAQPLMQDGEPIQSAVDLAGNAAGHLLTAFPNLIDQEITLEEELPLLRTDPHLAIYWLIHTAVLAQDAERARVLAEISTAEHRPELLEAFAEVFAAIAIDGDLTVVPEFRTRRALLLQYLLGEAEGHARAALTTIAVAPDFNPLNRAFWIFNGLNENDIDTAEVTAALDHVPDSIGTTWLRADLDRRAGLERSAHADALMRRLPADGTVWATKVWAMEVLMPVTGDGPALAAAAAQLLEKDPYSRVCLAAVARAHELAGEPLALSADELAARITLAESSAPVLLRLQDDPEAGATILDEVGDPALAVVIAERILRRADVDEPGAATVQWALRTVLASDRPDRSVLAATGLELLPVESRAHMVSRLSVASPDDPLVPVLIRLLEHTPEPGTSDIVAEMHNEKLKEADLKTLAPIAHEPAVFDELMRLAELPGPASTVAALWQELFNPFEQSSYILHNLAGEQASRAAAAMLATLVEHPDIGARSTAGHQLFRFDHAGAEAFLIEALDEYSRRYAASDPANSPELGHGQTLDDQLEDAVADLYSALRNVKTPTARTALIDRLFTEQRSIWRMCDAVKEIFSPEVHREIMARLRETRDHRAAAHYANTLHTHLEKRWPKVKLLEEITAWPAPKAGEVRRIFKYALEVGIQAALEAKDFDLVRAANHLRESIAEESIEPDALVRDRSWTKPLADEQVLARLAQVLTGEADAARQALADQGETARAAGKPLKKIKDDQLADLAGTTVRRRLLHDQDTGEVWFLDPEGAVTVFDGYGIAAAPFQTTPIGYWGMKDFLVEVDEMSERALLWTKSRQEFVDLVRYAERISYRWGVDNGLFETVGLTFPDAASAADAFARIKATCIAAKYTETDPWYVPGKAAVLRIFKPHEHDGEWEKLMGFDRTALAVTPEASAVADRREVELHREGMRLASIEWVTWEMYRVREEMTVADWMQARIRDDAKDAAWHVSALTEIVRSLETAGFTRHCRGLDTLNVEVGPPAAPEHIAALEAARGVPLPAVLKEFWSHIGSAEWRLGDAGMRIVGPDEILASVPRSEARGRELLGTVPSNDRERWEPILTAMHVLSVNLADDSPDVIFTEAERADGRVFAHTGQRITNAWWEKSLSWMFATSFLDRFAHAIELAAPETAMLYCGQQRGAGLASRRFEFEDEKSAKFWEVWTDPALDVVATRYGKLGSTPVVSSKRCGDREKAAKQAAKLIAAKVKSGYGEVEA